MQLKHLFVFLLVLALSVADSTVYSQENNSTYYQSSKVFKKKNFNYINTKQIVFNYNLTGSTFLAIFFPGISQKNIPQKETQRILKIQMQLYQKIASLNTQRTFLITKITSSNSFPNLYIA